MRKGFNILPAAAVAALCLELGSVPASAQAKPAESTSKVKKVMLYNRIGGWPHTDGIADVKSVMTKLAAAKGFQLTQVADDVGITLDYLKQFQVIVWNNNTNGGSSMPSSTARSSRALTTSAPAWCPSSTGSPRPWAQRPFPSVMMAT